MTARRIPAAQDLTRAQHDGHACVWCGTRLWRGAVSAGISRGRMGAHSLDAEVFACPDCAISPQPNDAAAETPGPGLC